MANKFRSIAMLALSETAWKPVVQTLLGQSRYGLRGGPNRRLSPRTNDRIFPFISIVGQSRPSEGAPMTSKKKDILAPLVQRHKQRPDPPAVSNPPVLQRRLNSSLTSFPEMILANDSRVSGAIELSPSTTFARAEGG